MTLFIYKLFLHKITDLILWHKYMDNFYYKIRRLIFNDWLLDSLLEAVDDGMPIKVIASRFNLTTYTTRKLIEFARSPGRATRNPEDVAYCTRYQDPNNNYEIDEEFVAFDRCSDSGDLAMN